MRGVKRTPEDKLRRFFLEDPETRRWLEEKGIDTLIIDGEVFVRSHHPKSLTEQQALIHRYISQGYPMTETARLVGCRPSQVADQLGLIRKKGYEVHAVQARDTKVPLRPRRSKEAA